jgi:hypothetical protein
MGKRKAPVGAFASSIEGANDSKIVSYASPTKRGTGR